MNYLGARVIVMCEACRQKTWWASGPVGLQIQLVDDLLQCEGCRTLNIKTLEVEREGVRLEEHGNGCDDQACSSESARDVPV
jgi:hypothetical protein